MDHPNLRQAGALYSKPDTHSGRHYVMSSIALNVLTVLKR